ncbi:MAG: hypothetical protein QOF68_2899 [Gaiellales bacterium]|jgi:hypothetical protein|nr:hypothetical protein [Gaiellales bacterium]
MGARFYLTLAGISLAVGLGALLVFSLIGVAWAAWGFFGMFAALSAVLLLGAWIYDRRQANLNRY